MENSDGVVRCDACGEVIERMEHAWVEWVGDEEGEGHDLRIVHHATVTRGSCYRRRKDRQDGSVICDKALSTFICDGVMDDEHLDYFGGGYNLNPTKIVQAILVFNPTAEGGEPWRTRTGGGKRPRQRNKAETNVAERHGSAGDFAAGGWGPGGHSDGVNTEHRKAHKAAAKEAKRARRRLDKAVVEEGQE